MEPGPAEVKAETVTATSSSSVLSQQNEVKQEPFSGSMAAAVAAKKQLQSQRSDSPESDIGSDMPSDPGSSPGRPFWEEGDDPVMEGLELEGLEGLDAIGTNELLFLPMPSEESPCGGAAADSKVRPEPGGYTASF